MSLHNPCKSLRQISLEKLQVIFNQGIQNSSVMSFSEVEGILRVESRHKQILLLTDRHIKQMRDFLLGQLPCDVINDLVEFLSVWLTDYIDEKTIHKMIGRSDIECPNCHNIVVATRFSRLFLDSRVKKLDLDFLGDILKRELVKGIDKCLGKKVLNLSHLQLPISIEHLNKSLKSNMKSLRFLKIDFLIQNSTLAAIGSSCPLLEHIELDQCFSVNNKGLSKVVKGCKNLKTLLFGSPPAISSQGFADALLSLPKLERIGRSCISLISILRLVSEKYPKKVLKLKFFENACKEVIGQDDSFMELVSRMCPELRHVSLQVYCPDLSSLSKLRNLQSLRLKGIIKGAHHQQLTSLLSKIGHQLTTIELRKTSDLSIADVKTIGLLCPNLDTLILHECSINENSVVPFQTVKNNFLNLRVIYFSPTKSASNCPVEMLTFILKSAVTIEEVYVEECYQLTDEHLISVLESGGLQLLRKFQVSCFGHYPTYNNLSLVSVHALTQLCTNLVDIGNLYKWNVNPKVISDLVRIIKDKNLKIKFSTESLKKFHDHYFYF